MGKITEALQKAQENRMAYTQAFIEMPLEFTIKRHQRESKVDPRLVPYFDTKSVITEQYKSLVTNVFSMRKRLSPAVVAISSSVAGEGKTVTALNLSIVLSHAVHKPKVLLIDADMRRGQVIRYLGVEQEKGLSDYLTGQASLDEIIFHIDIEHLSFISCGTVPSHPADLLGSQRMSELIKQLSKTFEFILIDTPPVIPVADAAIVGSLTDGILLVIKAGETQRGMVRRSRELLIQAHTKIIGHVLTGIEYFVPHYLYRYL